MGGDARTLQIEESSPKRRHWTLFIYPDYLRFVADEGSGSFDVDFSEAAEELVLHTPLLGRPVLIVRQERKVCFRLDRHDFTDVKAWLGPPTIRTMKATLKQQLAWGIGVGLFLLLSSLPKPADPEANLQALPFDPVSGALGLSLILLRLLGWLHPCRELFLADAAWFLLLGGKVGYDVLSGSSSIWLAVTVICVVSAIRGLERYQQFSHLAGDEPQAPERVDSTT
ncbi:MAG: hypothetical protein ACE15E_10985 [Acidobacteriota bacterium]